MANALRQYWDWTWNYIAVASRKHIKKVNFKSIRRLCFSNCCICVCILRRSYLLLTVICRTCEMLWLSRHHKMCPNHGMYHRLRNNRNLRSSDCVLRLCQFLGFLRMSAMLKHVIDIVWTSARPSVTRWHGIKTAERLVMISSPHDSPFILVFV